MADGSKHVLTGGNMNSPVLRNDLVYKKATAATGTIHKLLKHVRSKGIDWVPDSFGIDTDGKHVLSFIKGDVPHNMPDWIWNDSILCDIAGRLRLWHDATGDFDRRHTVWLLENDEEDEVICHNDFAPYNCVFRSGEFAGLIDFDLCSPGSRLWDIAYTAYRFVPLLPTENKEAYCELSPFPKDVVIKRLRKFLDAYGHINKEMLYAETEVIEKAEKRLKAIASWSENYGGRSQNLEMLENAKMYALHADWVKSLL